MKIYCEPLGESDMIEDGLKSATAKLPVEMPQEIKKNIDLVSTLASSQYRRSMELHQENAKLRLMWNMRSIENEIEQEDGNFVINSNGSVSINGFSPQLTNKINDLIDKFRKP
ncbi:MAG: hypothetical protein KGO82_08445 [Bacteroidota bacterium]|nr:hypothetical protein [Bacteroidota bacterium]